MNKLRQWLLRPSLRAVLGQRQPRFHLSQVFTERKILLVPLRKAILGPEAAALLGSLVVAQLWQTIQARAAIPASKRHPVMVYIDEVQDYLHLPHRPRRRPGPGPRLRRRLHPGAPVPRPTAAPDAGGRAEQRPLPGLLPAQPRKTPSSWPRATRSCGPEDFTSLGQFQVYASLFARGAVTPYASGQHPAAEHRRPADPQRITAAQPGALRPAAGRDRGRLHRPAHQHRAVGRRPRAAPEAAMTLDAAVPAAVPIAVPAPLEVERLAATELRDLPRICRHERLNHGLLV